MLPKPSGALLTIHWHPPHSRGTFCSYPLFPPPPLPPAKATFLPCCLHICAEHPCVLQKTCLETRNCWRDDSVFGLRLCLDISKPVCRACTAKFCHSCSIWSVLPLHLPSPLPEAAVCARLSLSFGCYTANSVRGILAPLLAWPGTATGPEAQGSRDPERGRQRAALDPLKSCAHRATAWSPSPETGPERGCQLPFRRQSSLLQKSNFL